MPLIKTVANFVFSLIGVLLPVLFILSHSSLRLRNLKNKVGRPFQMSYFHWSVSSFLSSSPPPALITQGGGISKTRNWYVFVEAGCKCRLLIDRCPPVQSQKQGIVMPFIKTVINVVFLLIGVFLTGLLHLFFSHRNLCIKVVNCLSKFGRVER